MIGSISGFGVNTYYNPYLYRTRASQSPAALQEAGEASRPQTAPAAQRSGVWTAQRAASPETPVQPVDRAPLVGPGRSQPATLGFSIPMGADPAEMAVRMRIRPYEESAPLSMTNPGEAKAPAVEGLGVDGAQKALEEGQCETCEKRKYQDGSDDMGVSFQSPTRVDPDLAAAAVRGHENEHVVREQAKAQQEGRKVVSQSVTLHSEICPECGKTYISGGTTRTTTAAKPEQDILQADQAAQERKPFSVFA